MFLDLGGPFDHHRHRRHGCRAQQSEVSVCIQISLCIVHTECLTKGRLKLLLPHLDPRYHDESIGLLLVNYISPSTPCSLVRTIMIPFLCT